MKEIVLEFEVNNGNLSSEQREDIQKLNGDSYQIFSRRDGGKGGIISFCHLKKDIYKTVEEIASDIENGIIKISHYVFKDPEKLAYAYALEEVENET